MFRYHKMIVTCYSNNVQHSFSINNYQSIQPIAILAFPLEGHRGLEPIPSCTGWEVRCNMDVSATLLQGYTNRPLHHSDTLHLNCKTKKQFQWPFGLLKPVMFSITICSLMCMLGIYRAPSGTDLFFLKLQKANSRKTLWKVSPQILPIWKEGWYYFG